MKNSLRHSNPMELIKILSGILLAAAVVALNCSQLVFAQTDPSNDCVSYRVNPRTQQSECLDDLTDLLPREETTPVERFPASAAPLGSQFRNRGTNLSDDSGDRAQSDSPPLGGRFRNRRRGW